MKYAYLLLLLTVPCLANNIVVTLNNDFGTQVFTSAPSVSHVSDANIPIDVGSSHEVGDIAVKQTFVIYVPQGLAQKRAYKITLSSVKSTDPQEAPASQLHTTLNVNEIIAAVETGGSISVQINHFISTFNITTIPIPKISHKGTDQVSEKTRYNMLFTI